MNKELARAVILASKGGIMNVGFTKADGSFRQMLCRNRVKKGVKGTGAPLKVDTVMRVFDMKKQAWRTIPLERVEFIRTNKAEVRERGGKHGNKKVSGNDFSG